MLVRAGSQPGIARRGKGLLPVTGPVPAAPFPEGTRAAGAAAQEDTPGSAVHLEQEHAASAARTWPSAKQPTVSPNRPGGTTPSAMRPWVLGLGSVRSTDGGGTGHGRARTGARRGAEEAADGADRSGHADRPRPDSRLDLPFQDACSVSPSPSRWTDCGRAAHTTKPPLPGCWASCERAREPAGQLLMHRFGTVQAPTAVSLDAAYPEGRPVSPPWGYRWL